jgi:hypothetical protein
MNADPNPDHVPRAVRVSVPARAEFEGNTFLIKEFTANIAEGGIFLITDEKVEPGVTGKLTLQISPWDRPFTVQAEVVRSVPPDPESEEYRSGLGIKFIEMSDADRKSIRRLVDGLQDGSVAEAIRRSLRESPHGLVHELRQRPVDQKVILAISASSEEIDALISDGQQAVIKRLLENPRVTLVHARKIIRDPRLTPVLLLQMKRRQEWWSDEEFRGHFCMHPKAPVHEVSPALGSLSVSRLKQMAIHPNVRLDIRNKAKEALRRKGVQA